MFSPLGILKLKGKGIAINSNMNFEDKQYKILVNLGKATVLFVAFILIWSTFNGLIPAKDTPRQVSKVSREKQKINGKVTAKIDYISHCAIDIIINNRVSTFEVDRQTFNKAIIGQYMELEY